MANLGFSVFDCDNHYYEALDAFTRHIEPEYAKRTMQWATINGKQYYFCSDSCKNECVKHPDKYIVAGK